MLRFFSKQLLVVANRHSWRRFFQTIKVNIKSLVKKVLVMNLKCDFLHFPFFNIFAPWSIVYTYPDDNTLSFQLYLYACIQTWHFGKYLPQKQMYKSVFTIFNIYIAIWFLLHIWGYIIQLSFHVVDVNINLDLYKCTQINHRKENFRERENWKWI